MEYALLLAILFFSRGQGVVVYEYGSQIIPEWGCPLEEISKAGGLPVDSQPQIEWRHDVPSADSNCDSFVRCLDARNATRMVCPSGLSYSILTGTCDLSTRAVCHLNCPKDIEGYFPYPGDCGAYFKCSHGKIKIALCGEDLSWDSLRKRCDRKKCEYQCPSNSTGMVRPLALPWGESSYLVCDELSSSVRHCPTGLYFDVQEGICNYREGLEWKPQTAEKEEGGGKNKRKPKFMPKNQNSIDADILDDEGPEGVKGHFRINTSPPHGEDEENPSPDFVPIVREECPQYGGDFPVLTLDGREANSDTNYFTCRKGTAVMKTCPRGYVFDPSAGKCDRKKKLTKTCPEVTGEFPILGFCSKYLSCVNDNPKVKYCPIGLQFDHIKRVCEVPAEADCEIKCKHKEGTQPMPNFCDKYVECVGGIPRIRSCASGLKYNPITETCDLEDRVECPQKVNVPFNSFPFPSTKCPKPFGTFPVLGFCDRFLLCEYGKAPEVRRCGPKLHYNQLTGHCDIPKRAQCPFQCPSTEMDKAYPIKGYCSKFVRCTKGVSKILSCAKGLVFNADTEGCEEQSQDNDLHCQECPSDGVFPVKGRKDAANLCWGGHLEVTMVCSTGLIFDAEEGTCAQVKVIQSKS